MQVDSLMKHGYYPTAIYKVFVNTLYLQYQSWGKGRWTISLLALIVQGYSSRVAVLIRSYSSNPFCGHAALVGDWRGSWSVSYWVCDSFNWLLHPAPPHTFHGASAHFLSHSKTPHAEYDRSWMVSLKHDLSGGCAWTYRVGESTGGGALHRKKKRKK